MDSLKLRKLYCSQTLVAGWIDLNFALPGSLNPICIYFDQFNPNCAIHLHFSIYVVLTRQNNSSGYCYAARLMMGVMDKTG